MIKKLTSLYFWITLMLITVSVEVLAQAAPDSSDAFSNVDDVPLDGGIAVLVVAGVGFGIRKLYNRKK